jgi:phage terminase large subunit-like protein
VKSVRASRGKFTRAEPVAALYEQGRARHIGVFAKLEDQMCLMTSDFDRVSAGFSPDRVDALVWAVAELVLAPADGTAIIDFYRRLAADKQT